MLFMYNMLICETHEEVRGCRWYGVLSVLLWHAKDLLAYVSLSDPCVQGSGSPRENWDVPSPICCIRKHKTDAIVLMTSECVHPDTLLHVNLVSTCKKPEDQRKMDMLNDKILNAETDAAVLRVVHQYLQEVGYGERQFAQEACAAARAGLKAFV